MIKKAEIITILAVLFFVYIIDSAKAEITDVEITPEEPTTEDIITIGTIGIESSGPVTVIDSVVNIIDTEIGLDITLEKGPYAVMTPWSYSQDIGILPAGTYDLTVRTIVSSVITDTYFTTFQVAPEHDMTLDGSGTQEDPWLIQSLDDFNDFAADANYWDDYTRLETDVNLAGMVYERAVIGDRYYDDEWIGTAFSGVFDGNDHKILNLTIDDGGAGNNLLGLFGNIESDGQVRNLGLEGGSVSGGRRVGGLVGWIEEYGTVSNCYSTGDVNGGGIVGGLIGFMYGSSVSNCYSTGDVSGTADHIGGLVGYAAGIVSNCYSTGNVSGDYQVGGLMGGNENISISNCYSTGDVNGVGEVGGLMGLNGGSVSNCYSTGDVQGAGVENVGGLMGYNYGPIRDCFWDIETSGEPNMCGNEHSTCDNSYGKTTAQMHQQSTFTDWDFIDVWNIGENQTYPYLRVYLPSDINKDGIVNFLDFAITANKWLEGDKRDE